MTSLDQFLQEYFSQKFIINNIQTIVIKKSIVIKIKALLQYKKHC